MDTNKKTIIIAVVVVIVLAVVAGLAWYGKRAGWWSGFNIPGAGAPKAGKPVGGGAEPTGLLTVEGGTRNEITQNIKTPEPGAISTNPNIAVPESAVNLGGGEGASADLRTFEIKAENNKFSPSTIVVNELDVITIKLTAVDKKYNIFFPDFGAYKEAEKGQTAKFQFQASRYGQYKFYCQDICSEATAGTLIVNKK